MGAVVDKFDARRTGIAGDRLRQIITVDAIFSRKCGAGERGDGGQEVERGGELVAGRTGGDPTGTPHDARHPLATFESGALAAA